MKNLIVGTAGHVDHGKTCLIKALTGTDTDRLKEEKKRGITIELGFATLLNDSDFHIGIIDVPGHEKFVKNMLAGVGGMNLVLLIVALDEGLMPQTREHFDILKMIGIQKGIIVYTKCDIAEEGFYDIVKADVDEMVKGSFLENAPSIKVSAYTGENIKELKQMILDEAKTIEEKRNQKELTRIPIDRVFTMEGFGTVITGTLLEGRIDVGDELEIYPKNKIVRVRQLESHNQKEQTALCGQRTAINLTGVNKEEIKRGDVLACKGSMFNSTMIDVRLSLFDSTNRQIKSGDKVHISYGSCQTECRVFLFGKKVLSKKESCYAQLRFNEEVSLKRGDKYIVRFISPVETIGGGVVLDPSAKKHKGDIDAIQNYLQILESGDDEKLVLLIINSYSNILASEKFISKKLNFSYNETKKILEKLLSKGDIIKVSADAYVSKEYFEDIANYSKELLSTFHKDNSVLKGMNKEEFKDKIKVKSKMYGDTDNIEKLTQALIEKKKITVIEGLIANTGFDASGNRENKKTYIAIEKIYKDAGIEVPSVEQVLVGFNDRKIARQIINDLTKENILVKVDNDTYIHKEAFNKALEKMYEYYNSHKEMTLADFRNLLSTSRKYGLFILDTCDRLKITKREGDARVLIKKIKL